MSKENAGSAPALSIQKFNKALHDRSAFSCGTESIDNFLKYTLSGEVKSGMVVAWVATKGDESAVLGFYTLGAMSISAEIGLKDWRRTSVPEIPVIFIRALGVHEDVQGMGYGKALVSDAIKRCINLSEQMGAFAIVLDVIEDDQFERRWKFYSDIGFQPLNDPNNKNRVYISLTKAGKIAP